MLRLGRCLARLTQQNQLPALGPQACRVLCDNGQDAACSAVSFNTAAPSRSFFAALGVQQLSGSPMLESHGDAEEENQRREDLQQHRGTPQDTTEVQHSEEAKNEPQMDTQNYQPGTRQVGDSLPAGHMNSDLSSHSCSLVLGRRRDLTLRGDVTLSRGTHSATLSQLLKDRTAIIFGVPDMGPICTERHVPEYLEKLDEIIECGISSVYCVSNASADQVGKWSKTVGIEERPKIEAWADESGSLIRMLGLEANLNEGGSNSHRWAAITQDGILLKMRVEANPLHVKETSAESMLACWRYFKELESMK